jgi:hypothetical protein
MRNMLIYVNSLIISLLVNLPVSANPVIKITPDLGPVLGQIPDNFYVRLPEKITLNRYVERLFLKTFVSNNPRSLTVGLYGCDEVAINCYIGTIRAETNKSYHAIAELYRHKQGSRITLSAKIQGYVLLESNNFASVMWEQEGIIYRLTFNQQEKQKMLLIAYQMVNTPLKKIN